MDPRLYELHLEAGRKAGSERTCGKKQAYASEEAADRAAAAHNKWEERRHDVEAYPCAFCGNWHIGGVMPVELLQAIASGYVPGSDTTD